MKTSHDLSVEDLCTISREISEYTRYSPRITRYPLQSSSCRGYFLMSAHLPAVDLDLYFYLCS